MKFYHGKYIPFNVESLGTQLSSKVNSAGDMGWLGLS